MLSDVKIFLLRISSIFFVFRPTEFTSTEALIRSKKSEPRQSTVQVEDMTMVEVQKSSN